MDTLAFFLDVSSLKLPLEVVVDRPVHPYTSDTVVMLAVNTGPESPQYAAMAMHQRKRLRGDHLEDGRSDCRQTRNATEEH